MGDRRISQSPSWSIPAGYRETALREEKGRGESQDPYRNTNFRREVVETRECVCHLWDSRRNSSSCAQKVQVD